MLRTATTSVLILLAACQATSPASQQQERWRWQMEQSQASLQRNVQQLRSLLAERAVDPACLAASGAFSLGAQSESAGTTELIARLQLLADQIEQLNATMSTPTARPLPAAHGSSASHASHKAASSTLEPLQRALLVIEQQHALHCENIANCSVPGYKLRQLLVTSERHAPTGLMLPKAGKVVTVMTTGTLEITERSLDVAVDGNGFFVVHDECGEQCFTRCGNLELNANGRLVTSTGAVLVSTVVVPNDTLEISIDPHGRVSGRRASNPDTATEFGCVQLARFLDASQLQRTRDGLLKADAGAAPAITAAPGSAGLGLLKQGFIERSNVQLTTELINLQSVQRQAITVRRVLAAHGIYTR
tara:strand:+ start:2280 stop:3362 length:1083 start_codon:yes stop_codon:yes gene_type:complete